MEEDLFYKKMYHIMMNAVEDAIRTLVDAQLLCEEMYLDRSEPELLEHLKNGENIR